MRFLRGRSVIAALAVGLLSLTACSSSGGFKSNSAPSGGGNGSGPLTILFGTSGPAETKALQDAAAAWTKQSGIKVNVTPAQNLQQQVAQGFAANKPPDVFYLDTASFQTYAKQGALLPYASQVDNPDDFYPALKQSFTYNGQFYCVPKDWSTFGLVINQSDWAAAGLTDKDVPTNWAQLETVAKKLTTGGRAGLTLDPSYSGLSEFFYQNGGTLLSADKKTASFDSPQNVAALQYLKKLISDGSLKFPATLSTGGNGEAFGKNKAAMTIIGNWIDGQMSSDYPSVKYQVVPLPAGPTGTKATMSFTNCWGIPKASPNSANAIKLVNFLASPSQQMTFAKAYGVMPSRESTKAQWTAAFPKDAAFLAGADYAQPDLAIAGGTQATADFSSQLSQLASADPSKLLASVQKNFEAVIKQNG